MSRRSRASAMSGSSVVVVHSPIAAAEAALRTRVAKAKLNKSRRSTVEPWSPTL